MATGEGAKLGKYCERESPEGSKMAQKLLESTGALEGPWPLGRGQNYVNICKSEESEGSRVAQKIKINWRAGGAMATGEAAKLRKYM